MAKSQQAVLEAAGREIWVIRQARCQLVWLVAVLTLASIAISCTGGSSDAVDVSKLSVEEVYDRVAKAITSDGVVLHSIGDVQSTGTDPWEDQEFWIDGGRDLARWTTDPPETYLIEGGAIYTQDSCNTREQCNETTGKGLDPPQTCAGVNAAVSVLLQFTFCGPFPLSPVGHRIEPGDYSGTPAVVVVSEGELNAEGEIFTLSGRYYVQRDSFLPLGYNFEYASQERSDVQTSVVGVFTSDFIQRDSLPDDFFNPASVGYDGQ